MNNLLFSMLEISLTTSIAIVVLLMARQVLSKRYAARLRVALWLVVAARLLVPINFTLPAPPVQVSVPKELFTPFVDVSLLSGNGGIATGTALNVGVGAGNPATLSWVHILFIVWVAGMVCVLGFHVLSVRRLLKRLRRYAAAPGDTVLAHYQDAVGQTGTMKAPALFYSPIIQAPMLIGWFHPAIYLPKKEYSDAELRLIFCHELTHYKRKDLWAKRLLLLATAAHWFNPLVWVMAQKAGTDIELACDEMVSKDLDRVQRAAYGHAILEAAGKGRPCSAASTQFGSGKNVTKKRILSLFDFSRKKRGRAILAGFLCLFVLAGTLVACVPQELAPASTPGDNSTLPGNQADIPSSNPASLPLQQTVEGTVTIDSVNILLYDNDPASPYIKDLFTNNTNQTIVGWQSGMLAFDALGNPVEVDWYAVDSSAKRSYENVCEIEPYLASGYIIAPGETHDVNGGWSIFNEVDANGTCTVAYALYCFKEITFEDGTVWTNPNYDAWVSAYCGNKLDVAMLETYYALEQATVTI